MNYETKLAAVLSVGEEEKLAAHFESYSADELAELLKTASNFGELSGIAGTAGAGALIAHALGRSPKTGALLGGATALGAKSLTNAITHTKRNAERNQNQHEAIPRAADEQWAREERRIEDVKRASNKKWYQKHHPQVAEKSKHSAIAEAWGRELAYEKVAGPIMNAVIGHAVKGLNWAGPKVVKGLGALGRSSLGQATVGGALGGAALGAGRHILSRPDPMTGRKQGTLLGSALKGGAVGAMGGAAAKAWHGVENVQNYVNKAQKPGGILSGGWTPPPAAKVQTASVRLSAEDMDKNSQQARADVASFIE